MTAIRQSASRSGRRAAALTAFASTLLVGAVAACGGKNGAASDAKAANVPPGSGTPAAPMTVGPENVTVVTTGLLSSGPAISGALDPEKVANIRAEVGGSLVQTFVDQGTRVSKGQLLGRIDATAINDAYLSARSAVTSAESGYDMAHHDLERNEKLLAAGAIAEREVESSRRAEVAARSQLEDAKARQVNAWKQLEYTKITAPFTGIVSQRQASSGDVVSPGTALFTVVDPTSMRFEASVPADQLSQVRIGSAVSFTVNGYPGRTFTGKIARINPTADRATGQVRIVVAVPNPSSGLVGGLFADGRIASAAHTALTVPYTAIDVRGVRPWVLRIKNGKAERREVELGLRDESTERVEITTGIQAGDTLLLGTAQGISPGTPVRVNAPADKPLADGGGSPPAAPAPSGGSSPAKR